MKKRYLCTKTMFVLVLTQKRSVYCRNDSKPSIRLFSYQNCFFLLHNFFVYAFTFSKLYAFVLL